MTLLVALLACDDASTVDSGVDDVAIEGLVDDPALFATPQVRITAPNWGFDVATDSPTVLIEGVADEGATVSLGDQTATGPEWSFEVALTEGDNPLQVVATLGDQTEQDTIVVRYTPGVPFASGARLSRSLLLTGDDGTVDALVQLDDPVERVWVGPSQDQDWGALTEVSPGRWHGSFSVDTAVAAEHELRIWASSGDTTDGTPLAVVEVRDPPSDEQVAAAAATLDVALAAFEAEGDDVAGMRAAARAVAAEQGVAAVADPGDGVTVDWVTDAGIPVMLWAPVPGTLGGGSPGARTSAGSLPSGPPPPLEEGALTATPDVRFALLTTTLWEHPETDLTAPLAHVLSTNACPAFDDITVYADEEVTQDALYDAFANHELVYLTTHGGRRYFVPGRGGQPVRRWNEDSVHLLLGGVDADFTTVYQRYQAEVLAGTMTIAAIRVASGANAFVYAGAVNGAWFRQNLLHSQALPHSIVDLSACNSMATSGISEALFEAGAAYVYGYTGSVTTGQANVASAAFWGLLLADDSTNTALRAVELFQDDGGPWYQDDAFPVGQGHETHHMGIPPIPGTFDTGLTGWRTKFDVDYTDVLYGDTAYGGDYFAYLFVDSDYTQAYAELGYAACPPAGVPYTLEFAWNIFTEERDTKCELGSVPYWWNARLDLGADGEDRHILYHQGFYDFCEDMDNGSPNSLKDGWRHQVVELEGRPVAEGYEADAQLSFSTGGYSSDWWFLAIDEVSLVPSEL